MPNVIQLKKSITPGGVPLSSQLQIGEPAFNSIDNRLFIKNNAGSVIELTHLSNQKGVLSSAQGGTGLSNSGVAGYVLTSDGEGGWFPSPTSVDLSNYVTLSTNQAIGGTKTFNNPIAIGKSTAPLGILDIKSTNTVGTDSPHLRLENVNTSTSLVSFDGGANNNDNYLDINLFPGTNTSNTFIRLFRYTNSTGLTQLQVCRGDGSATVNAMLNGNGNSYTNTFSGNFGIGTINPGAKLQVNGGISVSSTAASATDPGAGNLRTSGSIVAGTTLTVSTTMQAASIRLNTRTITAATTLSTTSDYTVACDASTNAFTVTLPSAATTGLIYNIKKIDTTANAVTIVCNGAQTIDGATTKVLTTQWTSITVQAVNSNWLIL